MKSALLIAAILLIVACRKPQAVFQKSNSEAVTEQPKRFIFKVNPIKIKPKSISIDSIKSIQNLLSKSIDNQYFVESKFSKKKKVIVIGNTVTQKTITSQNEIDKPISPLPFSIALGATILFALVVCINVLIVGSGFSGFYWIINSFLGVVGIKQKETSIEEFKQWIQFGFGIGFLAILMILITTMVLAI